MGQGWREIGQSQRHAHDLKGVPRVPDMGCVYLIETYQGEVMGPTLAEPQGVAVR